MSVRTRMLRKWRKNILRLGDNLKIVEILNKDDDGNIDPDKRNWGYHIKMTVKGWKCDCYGNNWYEVFQGADSTRRWAESKEASMLKNQNELGLVSSDSSLRESDVSGPLPASSGNIETGTAYQ